MTILLQGVAQCAGIAAARSRHGYNNRLAWGVGATWIECITKRHFQRLATCGHRFARPGGSRCGDFQTRLSGVNVILLNGLLAALRRSRETAAIRAAYDQFLERLDAAQVAAEALRAGDRMPGFLLPNAEGKLVDSAALLAKGPLVITFFRGSWCPYCSATLEALEAVLPELSRAGGTLVAVTPETGGRALAMKRDHGLSYEVLVDVDLAIAMAFGIVFMTPPLYAELLKHRGTDLAERSGNPALLLPVPAAFVVGQDGRVFRSWVNIDFTQRAEPTEILEALSNLQAVGNL